MEPDDGFAASMQRTMQEIKDGAPIPLIEAATIKVFWEAVQRVLAAKRSTTAIGLGAVAGELGLDLSSLGPKQHLAMALRYSLLSGLVECGALGDCMEDGALPERVFQAAATMPCGMGDLAEARVQKRLRESPPEIVETARKEMRQAGYDPDNSKVAGKFIEWMRSKAVNKAGN
jgi:hypothetical protein